MDTIALINQVINSYFDANPSIKIIPAKNLMPEFTNEGIFWKNKKNGQPTCQILRKLDVQYQLERIPYVFADRKVTNTIRYFHRDTAIVQESNVRIVLDPHKGQVKPVNRLKDRDEDYVLDLHDKAIKLTGARQHKFDFLLGVTLRKLPVNIYFAELSLIIECRKYQHSNMIKHSDKPDKLTASGVHRGEQQKNMTTEEEMFYLLTL